MSTYKYNKEDNTIIEVLSAKTLSNFENAISKIYTVSGKHNWVDEQNVQEGKDFELTTFYGRPDRANEERKVCVPINNEGKEADQPDWKEKAEKEFLAIIHVYKEDDNKVTAIINWIEDNKHLIR